MSTDQSKAGNRAINIGLFSNIFLAAVKTTVGIVAHSQALLADGINSTSDVAYYLIVKMFMIFAGKPPDREHPYGHRQFESIAALAVSAFVITTGIALFWDALNNVYLVMTNHDTAPVKSWALWIALFTVGAKLILTRYSRRVASAAGNAAILALARDHRNDTFTALGAASGIVLSNLGYSWGDPLVGGVVALIVLWTGIQILRESSTELMDAVPGEELENQTREVLRDVAGLKAVEEVQAHRFGPYFILNITIGIDGASTVAAGDKIASEVESKLVAGIALVKRVYVHYHPAGLTQKHARRTGHGRQGGGQE